jgi:hypothetical protein
MDLAWHSDSAAAVGVVVPADSMVEAVMQAVATVVAATIAEPSAHTVSRPKIPFTELRSKETQ